MSSNNQYGYDHRQQLLQLARASIQYGLETGKPIALKLKNYVPLLREKRATFVTLKKKAHLRGCIGMLDAVRPLIHDIAENAFSAAFKDPRFVSLTREEFPGIKIQLSILSPAEPISYQSEQDLLRQINPGQDGLILEEGLHRGTFLPTVWQTLPEPKQFLTQLKIKAGLSERYWSESIKMYRYTTETID